MQIKLPYLKKNGKYVLENVLDLRKQTDKSTNNSSLKPQGHTQVQAENLEHKSFLKEFSQREYDFLGFFQEGFALARIDERVFLIDYYESELNIKLLDVGNKKKEIFEIRNFENGLAKVKDIHGAWYLVNKNGLKINPYPFESIHTTFEEDGFLHGFVGSNSIFHLIHPSGAEISLSHIGSCNKIEAIDYKVGDNVILLEYPGSFHKALDYDGNELFTTKNFKWITKFNSGKAIGESLDGILTIIDKELECISLSKDFTCVDQTLLGFNAGFCVVKVAANYCLINYDGEIKLKSKYIWAFCNGFAKVFEETISGSRYYIINSNFEIITKAEYDEIGFFKEGIATYKIGEKWGYINEKGIEITPALFDEVFDCNNGFMEVGIGDFKNGLFYGKYGFFDREGKKVCPIIYDSIDSFNPLGFAKIRLGNSWGLLNNKGEEVIKPKFDSIDESYKDYYFVSVGEKRFVIDNTGHHYCDEIYYKDEYGILQSIENLPF